MIHTQIKQGQIRRIGGKEYIVTADTNAPDFNPDETEVVEITDLQNNMNNPQLCKRPYFNENDLEYVAESLEAWVASWNKKR